MPTLTFNVADLVGADFDARRTKVWIEANVDPIIDTTGKVVRFGDAKATVGDDGTGSFDDLLATNATDINPTGFLYRVWVDYASRSGQRQQWNSGWFPLTADTDLALVAPQANVPPPAATTDSGIASQLNNAGSLSAAAVRGIADGRITSTRGQANGIAPLDASALVPFTNVPDVQRNTNFGAPQHEDQTTYTYPNRINFGTTPVPPAVTNPPAHKGIDVIAHWYNDFGLEKTAAQADSSKGWYGWYDWQWNFPSNTGDGSTTMGYDPQRHPLQGYYQGDSVAVLAWQAKWLAEGGVNVASLVASDGADTSTWSSPSDTYYWMYQLFTYVTTFKALRWMMWLKHGSASDYLSTRTPGDGTHPAEKQWAQIVSLYSSQPGGYTYTEGGKVYPVVYLWDGEALRGAWDNYSGSTKTAAALKWLADQFKAKGYGGVMVAARSSTTDANMSREALAANGVIYLDGYYSNTGTGTFSTFADYANTTTFPSALDSIPAVQTSYKTVYPHTSTFNLPGSTPALFGTALRRAADSIVRNQQRRMVFINNVSEWAESGPGLLPNVQDGFGYLDQIRSLPVYSHSRVATDGLVQRVIASGGATTSLSVTVPAWARKIELRFIGSSTIGQNLLMQVNGDAGANYDNETWIASAATTTAAESFGQTSAIIGSVGDAAGRKGMAVVDLENEPGGLTRSWVSRGTHNKGNATTQLKRFSNGGAWNNSTTITSLAVLVASGAIRDGSVAELYCWR